MAIPESKVLEQEEHFAAFMKWQRIGGFVLDYSVLKMTNLYGKTSESSMFR